jgi:hypothetical protein
MPSKYNENINSIRKFNSDWTLQCWDIKQIYNLCLQYSKACAKIFNNYNLHNKKILAKYIILYNYGGVYLDLDCSVLKSFNTIPDLNSKDIILSFTPHEYIKNFILEGTFKRLLNTSTIVSSVKNYYIKQIIDVILNTRNKKIHEAVLVTDTLLKYQHDSKILLLDHRYFDSCHSLDSCCVVSKEAIVNHKHDLTWMNSWIMWILGCVLHLKEDYDHVMCCLFSLLAIAFFIKLL